ncbi:MAG: sigma 54-interacting transcriptional regulator, partial [Candidatus Omnitrophica bacterium]|nr:sigma 54-interacting transcriptional regulator [Candidatus Omnitrophota bacterium]
MPKLVQTSGDQAGREIDLVVGSNTIGRDLSNHIVVHSSGVSRHHATIRWEPPFCRILDQASTNGSFVNGTKVQIQGLQSGDTIRTGPIEWRLTIEETEHIRPHPPKVSPREDIDATVIDVVENQQVPQLREEFSKRGRPIRSDRDLATLYRTIDCLVSNTYPRPLLRQVVDDLVKAFSASGGAAFLVSSEGAEFELVAGTSTPDQGSLPVSKTIIRRALDKKETLLFRDAAAEGLSAESGSVMSLRIHSALAAPLIPYGHPLGALQLSRSPDQRPFNDKDLKLFSVISELIGMALVNCQRREELETENEAMGEIIKGRFSMLGNSIAIRKVFDTIEQTAGSTLTVLVQGESGTGKELVARAIHSRSPRKAGPFVTMNCAAVPDSLAESEIFGHEKGAFTGADDRRAGCFERAHMGSLFLDEVGELPLPIQAKLLRVLEQRELTRVGGEQTIKVDVRLIAATNRDLEEQVREGLFRQDLFFRLQVVTLPLPPLRERKEDIPLLAENFLSEYHESARHIPHRLSSEAIERLVNYPWPGNVRQLKNAVIRAAVLSPNEELTSRDFSFLVDVGETSDPALPAPLADVEKNHIYQVLEFCNWKREQAA